MQIMNQTQSSIINIDQYTAIRVTHTGSDKSDVMLWDGKKKTETLGIYKNEERAKAVLQEIYNKMGEFKIRPDGEAFTIPCLYTMPKE